MRILDRYIFFAVLYTTAAAIFFFGALFLGANALNDLATYVGNGVMDVLVAGRLLLLLVPFVATYALPMGVLVGILLAFGRLSADNEITAMRTAGIGLWRISVPALVLGLGGVALELAVNLRYMPWARVAYHVELNAAVRSDPLAALVPRTFIQDFPDITLYIDSREGDDIRGVWLWQRDKAHRVLRMIHANSGRVVLDEERRVLDIALSGVMVQGNNPEHPEDYSRMPYFATGSELKETIPLTEVMGKQVLRIKPAWMTVPELKAEMRRVDEAPDLTPALRARQRMRLQMVLQEKFSSAGSALAFTLLAVPLGIRTRRKETSANLGIALAVVLLYHSCFIALSWISDQPQLRPDLLQWIPNLALGGLGIWLYSRR